MKESSDNQMTNSKAFRNVLAIAMFLVTVVSCGTAKPVASRKTNTRQLHDSTLVDAHGNKYRLEILSDGNLWITTNLNVTIPGSYCYEDKTENCERYGRLYNWESANRGCKLLGENWRLPTSAEWRQLTILYGGTAEDFSVTRKTAYKNLLHTGTSEFNAVLGGGRAPDNQYARLEAHGFYWTATEDSTDTAKYYNFAKGSQALFEQAHGEKAWSISVRCVKSTDRSK
jgi:uncharacterized protein (TIGR02145 family)